MQISTEVLKFMFPDVGVRAINLFIKLKGVTSSGRIKNAGMLTPQRVGYNTRKPYLTDMVKLINGGYIKRIDVPQGAKPCKLRYDIQLKSWETISKFHFIKGKSFDIRINPNDYLLKEKLQAVVIQDSLYKQQYKAGKAQEKNDKSVTIIDGDCVVLHRNVLLDQRALTTLSYETLSRKLGVSSVSSSFRIMARLVELGFFRKFNQVTKSMGGITFKGEKRVKVLSNIYEVADSLLHRKAMFYKMVA